MIILIALGMILYVSYAMFIVDVVSGKCNDTALGMLLCLFAIVMPLAVLGQILTYMGVIQ